MSDDLLKFATANCLGTRWVSLNTLVREQVLFQDPQGYQTAHITSLYHIELETILNYRMSFRVRCQVHPYLDISKKLLTFCAR